MSAIVQFLPDGVTVTAEIGEPLLQVARRAGVEIPTGCLSGACHACEVEMGSELVCACISSVPASQPQVVISLYDDPAW
jgi:ferredoxin